MEIWSPTWLHGAVKLMQPQVLMNRSILLMSLLDSDLAEFLLQLFAMGVCQETGVTVLTATGTYAAYKSSVVVFYSCCGAHIQLLSLLIW